MAFDRKTLLATTFIAGIAMAAPSMAFAQSQEDEDDQRPRPSSQQATQVGEVVITGSRIRRNEFTATQPIQVITAEEATLEGLADTSEILQGSTAANTATQINNFFTGFVTTGGPGVNTISLRGLGANRTLVIFNGRRVGPAGARGTVGPTDLNVIPGSLIERVEILTDGASSIYGSDAVAGVINVITRTNLDGGRAEVFYSQPFESGGEELRLSLGQGWTFDRGYISAAAEYYRREQLTFGDREWFDCPQSYFYRDPNYQVRADVIDPATGNFKCDFVLTNIVRASAVVVNGGVYNRSGDFRTDPTASFNVAPVFRQGYQGCDMPGYFHVAGGAAAAGGGFNCSIAARPSSEQRAARGLYPLYDDRYRSRTAISPVERYSFASFAGFDLTPTTEVFGELLINRRQSRQDSWRQLFPQISNFHPTNPWGGNCNNTNPLLFCHVLLPVVLWETGGKQRVDYMRGVAGIRGSINVGGGWDWEIAAQYSRSDADYGGAFFYNDRVNAVSGALIPVAPANPLSPDPAVQAIAARQAAFRATGCDLPALLPGSPTCPGVFNWTDPNYINNGALPQAQRDYILGYEIGNTIYTHAYIEGLLTTPNLFTLPAGPAGAALGFQIRREEIDDQPGPEQQRGNLWGQSQAGRTAGSDSVREIFGELELPLVRNAFLMDSLTLNLSGRYSDYDSYGDNTTYKVGLNWQITPSWRIRASQGTSFRAPALFELYLANQTSFLGQAQIDPCANPTARAGNPTLDANCLAVGVPNTYNGAGTSSAEIVTGGGIGVLNPETAEAQSIGLIWTPSFIDLNIALDYYRIEVIDEVRQFGAGNIVNRCYTSEDFPAEPLCALITRAPPGSTREFQIISVNDSYVNIARQESEGLDLTMRYRHRFALGDLTLNARFTHILNWESQVFGTAAPIQNHQRIGSPDFVGNASARFDRGDWTYFWGVDFVGETSNADFLTPPNSGTFLGEPVFFKRFTDHYFTHNFSVRRRMDQWTLQAGINNVFDQAPPITSASGGGTRIGNTPLASQYDWIGRRVFFNIARSW
ncbi:MAG: TonB-dependent receptor plug domain-containing protein [Brevundimonas sp.]|uniref:TonB-dependent receptor plug domain-containing protein n=1 Tax=Brevundimonas sp. TaxID=1871086 RepID=UPI00391C4688